MKKIILVVSLVFCGLFAFSQNKHVVIHSHNDYQQNTPFWQAYTYGLQSIEIDLVLKDNQLYVAHDIKQINTNRTLETLYLNPLKQAIDLSIGQPNNLSFLIDLKSDPYKSLELLLPVLKNYESIINKYNISFVISGEKPDLAVFKNTPKYIFIDYQSLDFSKEFIWDKVAMVSLDFSKYSKWNGKGRLIEKDKKLLEQVIDSVHKAGKPIRFWATPDGKTAWNAFYELGVDIINSDKPYLVKNYIDQIDKNTYTNTSFFNTYTPHFKYDNSNEQIQNIIFLIGDGNGLSQISAAAFANKGKLSLLNLKSIGLIKTQSKDDFTTDSAAGATAFATGQKTYNRSIGISMQGEPLTNLTQILSKFNYNNALITTDEIVGATPAAFYAHQSDRDNYDLIAQDLVKSNINLFIGAGENHFNLKNLKRDFQLLPSLDKLHKSESNKVGLFLGKSSLKGVIDGRDDILGQATKEALSFLKKKNKPFFIMIEGAKIDTYGHFNNTGGIITEGIDFDKAVAQALEFADNNKNTLVIITADHETSGFAIPQGDMSRSIVQGDFISYDHTATMVPVFAYGAKSGEFTGVYENNEIFHKILKILNLQQE